MVIVNLRVERRPYTRSPLSRLGGQRHGRNILIYNQKFGQWRYCATNTLVRSPYFVSCFFFFLFFVYKALATIQILPSSLLSLFPILTSCGDNVCDASNTFFSFFSFLPASRLKTREILNKLSKAQSQSSFHLNPLCIHSTFLYFLMLLSLFFLSFFFFIFFLSTFPLLSLVITFFVFFSFLIFLFYSNSASFISFFFSQYFPSLCRLCFCLFYVLLLKLCRYLHYVVQTYSRCRQYLEIRGCTCQLS